MPRPTHATDRRHDRRRRHGPGPRVASLAGAIGTAIAGASLTGCTPYRIEYVPRPAWYAKASATPLPDRIVEDDGTVVIFYDPAEGHPRDRGKQVAEEGGKTLELRETNDEGEVVLRALRPEHVVGHLLTCLRNEEYRLLWDQLLSERTKVAYQEQGLDYEAFAAWCDAWRVDLARLLNRMTLGFPANEVVVEQTGNDVLRIRLWPHIGIQPDGSSRYKFTYVDIVREDFGLKLLMVR